MSHSSRGGLFVVYVAVALVIGIACVQEVSASGLPHASMLKCQDGRQRHDVLQHYLASAYSTYDLEKSKETYGIKKLEEKKDAHGQGPEVKEAEDYVQYAFHKRLRAQTRLFNAFRRRIAAMYSDLRREKRSDRDVAMEQINDLHACYYIERMLLIDDAHQPLPAEHKAYVQWSLLPPHSRPRFSQWVQGATSRRRTFAKTVLPSRLYNWYQDRKVKRGVKRWEKSPSDNTAPWDAALRSVSSGWMPYNEHGGQGINGLTVHR